MRKHKKSRSTTNQRAHAPPTALQSTLAQAKALLDKGKYWEAIHLLEPLVASHPRVADLHTMLGSAYEQAREFWNAVAHYEKALSLGRDKSLLVPLGFLYLGLELKVLALHAFHQALKSMQPEPLAAQLHEGIQQLEDELSGVAFILDLPPEKAAKGLRLLEEGQIALHSAAYSRSIYLNRKAIKFLGDFPPPHNNLSLALFFHGEPDEAIRTARRVTERHPGNIQSMSNLVRFLAWTGETEAARRVWEQLKPLAPHAQSASMKKVEAAAIMDADEDVYRLLKEKGKDEAEEPDQEFTRRDQLFLAVAEANLGRQRAAKRRLKALEKTVPWAGEMLKSLLAGKPGMGWAERYSYFHASELLPRKEMEAFLDLVGRGDEIPEAKFRREVERYAARFPQLVLLGKKTLLEDQQTEAAIALLATLATPEAYAVLREFGLGQAGDDESRIQALFALVEADQIQTNEPVRLWQDGEWRDVRLQKHEIIEGHEIEYAPQVIDLLDEAILAFEENRLAEAEKKYQRALALEPRAKEAYNNLAAIYARQEKHDRAREMFQEAIELDPLYVIPRCNLAMYLLDEEKVKEAEVMIAPLADVQQFHPQEMAFLSYIRAQIHVVRNEYDHARKTLEMALKVYPGYEIAQDLLDRLALMERMREGFSQLLERRRQSERALRERQRTRITTPDPTLAEALGIYTKDILTAIARLVIPWGGWSTYNKAQLHQYLVEYLREPESLARVLDRLTPEEKSAFELVLKNGGTLAWDVFGRDFGNDEGESPYWQYHEPETVMGRLRAHGLLVDATVDGKLFVSIPVELR